MENPVCRAGSKLAPASLPSKVPSSELLNMISQSPSAGDGRGVTSPSRTILERPSSRRARTRTFRPNYVSFSGTYQCNLSCPHCCVPIEWPDRLEIDAAVRFLEDANTEGVEIVGFTGG